MSPSVQAISGHGQASCREGAETGNGDGCASKNSLMLGCLESGFMYPPIVAGLVIDLSSTIDAFFFHEDGLVAVVAIQIAPSGHVTSFVSDGGCFKEHTAVLLFLVYHLAPYNCRQQDHIC